MHMHGKIFKKNLQLHTYMDSNYTLSQKNNLYLLFGLTTTCCNFNIYLCITHAYAWYNKKKLQLHTYMDSNYTLSQKNNLYSLSLSLSLSLFYSFYFNFF